MRVCIVDDEAHAARMLEKYALSIHGVEIAGVFTNPIEALSLLNGENPPDVAFLDIEMPGLSGLEMGSVINDNIKVVLVTSFNQFGPQAFEIKAADYLLKPVSYARFYNCIQNLQGSSDKENQEIKEHLVLFVKGGQKENYISIPSAEISHVRAALNYVEIFYNERKTITYLTLSEILIKLSASAFCRVHRSFIVNINKIKVIEQSEIEMSGGSLVPIGESFRDDFFKRIAPLILISKRVRR